MNTEKQTNEIVRKIRSDLRMSMNGIVSTSMREKGMDYKMNFGVDIPKLRVMATRYASDKALAKELWDTGTRELKILATMLFPPELCSRNDAAEWASSIVNQEIREQVCMNLFQKLDFSDELVTEWSASVDDGLRTTGFWLFARLVISNSGKVSTVDVQSVIDRAVADISHSSVFVRQAAVNVLKYAGRHNPQVAERIIARISQFRNSQNDTEREIFDLLSFEFGYTLD